MMREGVDEMQDKIEIRQIEFGTDEYKKELDLRDKILRKPLGLNIFDDDLENEKNDYHIGAFLNNVLVGILVLTELNDTEIRMRQVAVEEALRGNSIGSKLVIYAEEFAKRLGYKTMMLNSRKTSIKFYEKLGYEKASEEFVSVTILHYKMEKKLG